MRIIIITAQEPIVYGLTHGIFKCKAPLASKEISQSAVCRIVVLTVGSCRQSYASEILYAIEPVKDSASTHIMSLISDKKSLTHRKAIQDIEHVGTSK